MLSNYSFTSRKQEEMKVVADSLKDTISYIASEISNYHYKKDMKQSYDDDITRDYLESKIYYARESMERLEALLQEVERGYNE